MPVLNIYAQTRAHTHGDMCVRIYVCVRNAQELGEIGTAQIGTTLRFASVPLKKIGTWLGSADLVSVSYLYIDSCRVSAESRAGEWEL